MYWRKLLQTYLRRMCLVSILRQFVETRNCDEKMIESQTFCENMMAALCKLQLDLRFCLGKGILANEDTLLLNDVSWAAQTGKHFLRTQNVSEQNQKHFLCPQQMLRTRANGETFVSATMYPQQLSSFARA